MTEEDFWNRLTPEGRAAFEAWTAWHYKTHVRTPERFAMMWNRKTAEILDGMITDEIIKRVAKGCADASMNLIQGMSHAIEGCVTVEPLEPEQETPF